jgi:hypothetical protein
MKLNMGSTDRKIRAFLIAPLLVIVGIVAGPTGALAYVLYLLAVVMLVTGVVGFCPLYAPFKLSTNRSEHVGV